MNYVLQNPPNPEPEPEPEEPDHDHDHDHDHETETETESDSEQENLVLQSPFLKKQIITYMGNKRKLLSHILQTIKHAHKHNNNHPIDFADPFSGSGIVSRLALQSNLTNNIYSNDNALYAHIANKCHLQTPNNQDMKLIQSLITQANSIADEHQNLDKLPTHITPFISKHWAPRDDTHILEGERCYFTQKNAKRIDSILHFIHSSNNVPHRLKHYLLAPLITECSIHNNTNGQFAAFYKDEEGKGKFGGKKELDIPRITQPITLHMPLFHNTTNTTNNKHPTIIHTSNLDAITWAQKLRATHNSHPLTLTYIDPPYNKHPYNIYYFLLDIIAHGKTETDIPNTYRGQPKTWTKSPFNSTVHAKQALKTLIETTPSKFIALSYYDAGIIPIHEIDSMLSTIGKTQKFPLQHDTYNRLHGIGNYKRDTNKQHKREKTQIKPAKEFLWITEKFNP